MQGLGGELRRLGIASGQANRSMAIAEELGRKDYDKPKVPVIASKTVVTTTEKAARELQENLGVIATAYRNGFIDEKKAARLVSML